MEEVQADPHLKWEKVEEKRAYLTVKVSNRSEIESIMHGATLLKL